MIAMEISKLVPSFITTYQVVGCWHGYLSGARCRFAYAQLMSLPLTTVSCSSKSRLVLPSWYYLSATGSPG